MSYTPPSGPLHQFGMSMPNVPPPHIDPNLLRQFQATQASGSPASHGPVPSTYQASPSGTSTSVIPQKRPFENQQSDVPTMPGVNFAALGQMQTIGAPFNINGYGQPDPLTQMLFTQVHQLSSRLDNHEKNLHAVKEQTDGVAKQLEDKVATLEAKLESAAPVDNQKDQDDRQASGRKEYQQHVTEAIQAQMKDLMGVRDEREEGAKVYRLPLPEKARVAEDLPERMSGGIVLFNPNWDSGLNDTYNKKYINAVVDAVIKNSEGPGCLYPNLETRDRKDLEQAAGQFFSTLRKNYKVQMKDPKAIEDRNKRNTASKLNARKAAKVVRRMSGAPTIAKKYGVDISPTIQHDAMSSDEEGPGNVSPEEWRKAAAKYSRGGITVLERRFPSWRANKVSRGFYASDQAVCDQGGGHQPAPKKPKTAHVTFCEFPQNAHLGPPKSSKSGKLGKMPGYLLDDDWRAKNPRFECEDTKRPPDGWETLEIEDSDISKDDLQSLKMWDAYKKSMDVGKGDEEREPENGDE